MQAQTVGASNIACCVVVSLNLFFKSVYKYMNSGVRMTSKCNDTSAGCLFLTF